MIGGLAMAGKISLEEAQGKALELMARGYH
jgi:hypothetical protein